MRIHNSVVRWRLPIDHLLHKSLCYFSQLSSIDWTDRWMFDCLSCQKKHRGAMLEKDTIAFMSLLLAGNWVGIVLAYQQYQTNNNRDEWALRTIPVGWKNKRKTEKEKQEIRIDICHLSEKSRVLRTHFISHLMTSGDSWISRVLLVRHGQWFSVTFEKYSVVTSRVIQGSAEGWSSTLMFIQSWCQWRQQPSSS